MLDGKSTSLCRICSGTSLNYAAHYCFGPIAYGRSKSPIFKMRNKLVGLRVRAPDPEYQELLLPYGEVIQQLALAARKLILEEAPEASEFVYEVYTIADHFTFTRRPSDAFVFTTTHSNWINLGFNFGSMLPDPDGLLHGKGKWIRHIRIAHPTDLDASGVRELLRAAIAQAERPQVKAGKPSTTIHRARSAERPSSSNRRRPR